MKMYLQMPTPASPKFYHAIMKTLSFYGLCYGSSIRYEQVSLYMTFYTLTRCVCTHGIVQAAFALTDLQTECFPASCFINKYIRDIVGKLRKIYCENNFLFVHPKWRLYYLHDEIFERDLFEMVVDIYEKKSVETARYNFYDDLFHERYTLVNCCAAFYRLLFFALWRNRNIDIICDDLYLLKEWQFLLRDFHAGRDSMMNDFVLHRFQQLRGVRWTLISINQSYPSARMYGPLRDKYYHNSFWYLNMYERLMYFADELIRYRCRISL